MTINKDHLHAGCFERSGSLTQLTKSDAYSKNRPHPAASKIHIPLIHTHIEEGSYFVVRWCPRKKYVIYYLEKTPSFLRTPTKKNPFLQSWWHWVTSFPIFFFSKGNWILSPNWWSISTHPATDAGFWSLESLSSAERSVTFYLISHVSLLMGVGIGMLSSEF